MFQPPSSPTDERGLFKATSRSERPLAKGALAQGHQITSGILFWSRLLTIQSNVSPLSIDDSIHSVETPQTNARRPQTPHHTELNWTARLLLWSTTHWFILNQSWPDRTLSEYGGGNCIGEIEDTTTERKKEAHKISFLGRYILRNVSVKNFCFACKWLLLFWKLKRTNVIEKKISTFSTKDDTRCQQPINHQPPAHFIISH